MKKALLIFFCVFLLSILFLFLANLLNKKTVLPAPVPSPIPTQLPIPTTEQLIYDRAGEMATEEENFQRKNHPDVFLSNKTPYSTANFSIVNPGFKSLPNGHYYFTITLMGTNKELSKTEFINWLLSLGLTNNQIQNLDITYQ
ncbi:MAG: hypothetical protein M1268_04105 [Patescibacteria group bacterium]|nr:hypothetical protein [Patescibacteria group bacterium]